MRFCKVLAATLLLALGCQKLDVEKTAELEPGDDQYFQVTAPTRDQSVIVTAKSGGVAITAFVVKAKTDDEAKKIVKRALQKQPADEVLASVSDKADPVLEAVVPGGTPYYVVVSNQSQKEAKVTLKIAGREK